jgi:hypothetical protein
VQRILELIAELDRLRRETYGATPARSMLLGATSMIHPGNVAETYASAANAKKAGMDHVSFRVIRGDTLKVVFSAQLEREFRRQSSRVEAELVDDGFQVFLPTRPLTDTGYVPRRYFSRCLAVTQRALVEVGAEPSTPALVPCGRYRGRGFLGTDDAVMGTLGRGRDLNSVWLAPPMASLVRRFPDACGDCIDRSANIMLNGVYEAIVADPDTEFFRFARTEVH